MAEDLLVRIDNIQVRVVPFLFIPGNLVALAFCLYDHFGPWSRVGLGVTMAMGIGSVALHGIWRMGLRWRPVAAIVSFAVAFLQPATEPPAGAPDPRGFVIATVAASVAFWLYYKICISDRWWPEETPDEELVANRLTVRTTTD